MWCQIFVKVILRHFANCGSNKTAPPAPCGFLTVMLSSVMVTAYVCLSYKMPPAMFPFCSVSARHDLHVLDQYGSSIDMPPARTRNAEAVVNIAAKKHLCYKTRTKVKETSRRKNYQ